MKLKIPQEAYGVHMPVTRNIPIPIKQANSWWEKFKLWRWGLPKEELIEDFFYVLPKFCNAILGYHLEPDICVFIPRKFIFNGASVPKRLTSGYLPNGILYFAAFHHDFIFQYGELLVFVDGEEPQFVRLDQKQADQIFDILNDEANGFPMATKPAWASLRLFGYRAWNRCRQESESFESDFPEYAYLI
jgi:hypothetical protein